MSENNSKIKVLIVDDSAVFRKLLSEILSSDESIEVIGTATDPIVAVSKMNKQAPDVITLDVEMPRLNGIKFLKKIMSQHPLPVVICSSYAEIGTDVFNKAMEYGAADVMLKPQLDTEEKIEEATIQICDAVKAAALTKQDKLVRTNLAKRAKKHDKFNTADVMLKPPLASRTHKLTENIIVIGASTGGTQALTELLAVLPIDAPGILIVQHMPKGFTHSFAKRLNMLSKITVKEASDGDVLEQGVALIAPGDQHVLCKRKNQQYYVDIKEGPLVSRHRPSVDVLFRSAACSAGKNAIGVILTGMGKDGAQGMKELRSVGCHTIAQDEHSSVVFGMPKEAIGFGGVEVILPLDKIGQKMLSFVR